MKNLFSVIAVLTIIFTACYADAGNFGFGMHTGYGILKYNENTSAFGTKVESDTDLETALVGVSGEYTFKGMETLFAGITTDWVIGFEDSEKWKKDGVKVQTNNLEFFGEFYDLRFGYKNTHENLYYRVYMSGGWDGLHFRRDSFISRGVSLDGSVTEDFSLWRVGGGGGIGYRFGEWAVDGRAAYAVYPYAEVENSSLSGSVFETDGTCIDLGIGIARSITHNLGFYIGGSYTVISLEESDIEWVGADPFVFPDSKTEIIAGVVNLTYSF